MRCPASQYSILPYRTLTVHTPLDILFVSGPPLTQPKQPAPHEADCRVETINATMCVCKCTWACVRTCVFVSLRVCVWGCIHNCARKKSVQIMWKSFMGISQHHPTQRRHPQGDSPWNTHWDHCDQNYRRLLPTDRNRLTLWEWWGQKASVGW